MGESFAVAAGDPNGERPALVNVVATRCRPDGAAYSATILDLAARGHLVLTEPQPGHLACGLPQAAPSDSGTFPSERIVLENVLSRLAGPGSAPFEVLAEACSTDVRGCWDPFERAIRYEARRRGLTRPRLPAAVARVLLAGAVAAGVLVFLAVHAHPHAGTWAALTAGFFAMVVPASWVRSLRRQDRLTAAGAALAARWYRASVDDPATVVADGAVPAPVLRRLAYAVAAGVMVPVAGASPGRSSGIRPGRRRAAYRAGLSGDHEGTGKPRAAWSSLTGQWRLVKVPDTGVPLGRSPGMLLGLSAWVALLAWPASFLPDPAGVLLPLALLAAGIAGAVGGVRALGRRAAQPAVVQFDGQVIARWVAHGGAGDDDVYTPCAAIDDGSRAWSFEVGPGVFRQLSPGDRVGVRVAARSMKLLGLTLDGQLTEAAQAAGDRAGPAAGDQGGLTAGDRAGPAGERAGMRGGTWAGGLVTVSEAGVVVGDPAGQPWLPAAGRLLTADEISSALGRPVRGSNVTIPASSAVVYRGDGVTASVTVAEGALGGLSSGPARRFGRPLPGIGDEAWIVNRHRTAVVRVGKLTAKVTISGPGFTDQSVAGRSGPGRYGVISELAATIAARLAAHTPQR
jgi:hypothetical protein